MLFSNFPIQFSVYSGEGRKPLEKRGDRAGLALRCYTITLGLSFRSQETRQESGLVPWLDDNLNPLNSNSPSLIQ